MPCTIHSNKELIVLWLLVHIASVKATKGGWLPLGCMPLHQANLREERSTFMATMSKISIAYITYIISGEITELQRAAQLALGFLVDAWAGGDYMRVVLSQA